MPTHLRELLRRDGILVIPAVYDALSAKIAERLGFKAVGLGGFLVAASRLGLPDVGYLTMSEMVEAVRAMAGAVGIPLLADGDTGYGNPLNVRRTVQEYEAGGPSPPPHAEPAGGLERAHRREHGPLTFILSPPEGERAG